jgi:hypothetical protein
VASALTQWCQWYAEFWLAVTMTAQSHGARSYTKVHFHWLSGVNDTAMFWLSGATDTAESWLSGVIGDLKLENLANSPPFSNILYGVMFDEKNRIKKSRETVPLSVPIYQKSLETKTIFKKQQRTRRAANSSAYTSRISTKKSSFKSLCSSGSL